MENENMYNVEGLLNARLEPLNQELANASYDKLMKIEFDMQNIQERVTNITTTLTGITEENTDTLDTEDSHTL